MKTKKKEPDVRRQTLKEFIAAHGITMTSQPTTNNPHMEVNKEHPMDHWYCNLRNSDGSVMGVHFSTGMGLRKAPEGAAPEMSHDRFILNRKHNENHQKLKAEYVAYQKRRLLPVPPSVEDVMDCMASDSSVVENCKESFESWCSEYGYDTDSRKAFATYNTCVAQARQFAAFIGADYEKLLFEVERQ